jgi:hypothetical protein
MTRGRGPGKLDLHAMRKTRRRPVRGTAYPRRDKMIFKRLKFASYRDYLKSSLWKGMRDAQVEREPNCELCDCEATVVHHIDYTLETLRGNKPWKLVSLCNSCHYRIEFKAGGEKRTFEATMKRTRRLLKRAGRWEQHINPSSRKSPTSGVQPQLGSQLGYINTTGTRS